MESLFSKRDVAHTGRPLLQWEPPKLVSIKGMAVLPEQKMWLAILLAGIMETDPTYVITDGGDTTKRAKYRAEAVEAARLWRDSGEFDECCHNAQVDPKFARLLTAEKAYRAYQAIVTGKVSTFIETELGPEGEAEDVRIAY